MDCLCEDGANTNADTSSDNARAFASANFSSNAGSNADAYITTHRHTDIRTDFCANTIADITQRQSYRTNDRCYACRFNIGGMSVFLVVWMR